MTPTTDAVLVPRRVRAARRFLGALQLGPGRLDRTAMLAAAVLEAPVATLTVLTDVRTVVGVHGAARGTGTGPHDLDELGALVVAGAGPVAVDAAGPFPANGAPPAPTPGGDGDPGAYLGVPVLDAEGVAVGALEVFDPGVRRWTGREEEMLAALAASAAVEVATGHAVARHDRLLEAFESAPVAVAVVRGSDRLVEYVNPAFADFFPLATRTVRGAVAVDDLGLPGMSARVAEVVTTGRAVRDEDQRTRRDGDLPGRPDGDREATVSYSPIRRDPEGPPDVLVVGVDVTAQARDRRSIQRMADEQQLLARATAAMQTAVEPAAELAALARSLVPQFADACSAVLLERPVPAGTVAVSDVAGRRVAFTAADDLLESPPATAGGLSWGPSGLLAEVVASGRPAVADVAGDTRRAAEAAGSLDWLERVGITALAAAPIRVGTEVVGLLVFARRATRRRFTRADLVVMGRVSVRAGAALGQGMAFQRQRDTSLALQRSMLTDAPIVPGLQVVARYRPTAVDTEVGGDWYDAFGLPGGDLAVAIGDVAGHDLAAAATMGQLRSMLRALVFDRDEEPGRLLSRLDRVATGLHVTDFTTAVLGRLGPGGPQGETVLRWSNAGHPPPVVVRPDGTVEVLEDGAGIVMGIAPDRARPTAGVTLEPGSTVLLYTDGLVERRGADEDVDIAALVEGARAGLTAEDPGSLDRFCDDLVANAPVADDVAVLAVRLDGGPVTPRG